MDWKLYGVDIVPQAHYSWHMITDRKLLPGNEVLQKCHISYHMPRVPSLQQYFCFIRRSFYVRFHLGLIHYWPQIPQACEQGCTII